MKTLEMVVKVNVFSYKTHMKARLFEKRIPYEGGGIKEFNVAMAWLKEQMAKVKLAKGNMEELTGYIQEANGHQKTFKRAWNQAQPEGAQSVKKFYPIWGYESWESDL